MARVQRLPNNKSQATNVFITSTSHLLEEHQLKADRRAQEAVPSASIKAQARQLRSPSKLDKKPTD